ncbi:MAG: hypothetical protein QM765_47270 [Myxococcales bacterium]
MRKRPACGSGFERVDADDLQEGALGVGEPLGAHVDLGQVLEGPRVAGIGLEAGEQDLLGPGQLAALDERLGITVGEGRRAGADPGIGLAELLDGGSGASALAQELAQVRELAALDVLDLQEVAEAQVLFALGALVLLGLLFLVGVVLELELLGGERNHLARELALGEVGHPVALKLGEGAAGGLADCDVVALACLEVVDDLAEQHVATLAVEELDGGEDLGEGQRRVLLRRQQRHRRVHPLEGDELALLERVGEQAGGGRRERQTGRAAPGGLQELRQALVDPDGHRVAAHLGDHQVRVLVRERVQPVVAAHQRLGAGDHELVELADGDGPAGLDGLEGQRGEPRERPDVVQHLHADLAWGHVAQAGREGRALPLERVERVGREHRVLALAVVDDEVLALAGAVVLELLDRRPHQLGELVVDAALLDELESAGVVALLVANVRGVGEGFPVVRGLRHQLVGQLARSGGIPGLELGVAGLEREIGGGDGRGEQRKEGCRGDERGGPHFTISS